ncbi:MAG: hypothetical protein IT369_23525, partial [Candidatus Latescibacteria bacterium]|nr:hypothetical protein [Candidatus Latescibacterota bacterium]
MVSTLGLLLPASAVPAENTRPSFQYLALSVLHQRFATSAKVSAQEVLAQLAQESGLDQAGVQRQLLSLLDTLEAWGQGETAAWKSLTAMGGKEIKPQ